MVNYVGNAWEIEEHRIIETNKKLVGEVTQTFIGGLLSIKQYYFLKSEVPELRTYYPQSWKIWVASQYKLQLGKVSMLVGYVILEQV